MCLKCEKKYQRCADLLFLSPLSDSDKIYLLDIFEDFLGAEIDKEKAEQEMKALFDSWHVRGIMKPKK